MPPFERSTLAQTSFLSLATVAALFLLGFVLAYWTWVWFAPGAEPRAPEIAAVGAAIGSQIAPAGNLFGRLQRDGNAPTPTGINIKLHGVIAATGGNSGYAVLQLDGKQVLAIREGQEIAPGIRLAVVRPDHVILERNGLRETLAWPKKTKQLPASPLQK
ncbi:MAG TPA: type II secretion system protein N [Rhodocyclaceae bacterium]|nr:type II secretion system protein N [Rhodocyclaceae bacterium]